HKPVRFCDGMARRDFLRVGSLSAGAVGLSLTDLASVRANTGGDSVNCIVLFLVGGPSQLDTWDPKPNAPANIRGPFKPIRTTVPGLDLCQTFPLLAQRAERFLDPAPATPRATAPPQKHARLAASHASGSGVQPPALGPEAALARPTTTAVPHVVRPPHPQPNWPFPLLKAETSLTLVGVN